jgi:hypothetical protein
MNSYLKLLGTGSEGRRRQVRVFRGVLLLVSCLVGVLWAGEGPDYQAKGTRRMAERLAELTRTTDPMLNLFANNAYIDIMRAHLATNQSPAERTQLRLNIAGELLNAGRSLQAVEEFQKIEPELQAARYSLDAGGKAVIRMQQAVAYLRWGEQQNCQSNHNADRCLMPIRGRGLHQLTEGSTRAGELLLQHLQARPKDLAARWLLNIAAMTLGRYPDQVPKSWRIPPQVFESDYLLPRFPDRASEIGLNSDDLAGGIVADDFDGDGWLDVMVSSWDWTGQLRYFHNQGNARFVERTEEAGLTGLVGGLNLIQADYDNDGWVDLFVLRGAWLGGAGRHPNSLLRNKGDGTFADVTEEAGMLSFHPTQTAVWFDFDQDGWLDLFVGNESSAGALIGNATGTMEVHPCELFRNNGDGTFTECAASVGLNVEAFVKGVTAGDINQDGRTDLYLSVLGGANLLFLNDGPAGDAETGASGWRFSEVAAVAGVTEPELSFPTWFFDYDNDGWPDLFVAGYAVKFNFATLNGIVADILGEKSPVAKARLFRNNGDGTFSDVTTTAKLHRVLYAMGANFGDLDNDGWLDFYLGTGDPNLGTLVPNRMFRNAKGRFFQDVTTAGGFGHLQKGHGIAFADLNNDGNQDVVANLGGAYSGDNYRKAVFVNPRNDNRWLTLKLTGKASNRSAIGARIRVKVQAEQGERTIVRTVGSGGSFGASPLRQEIGLGQAQAILSAEIRWPSGKVQTIRDFAMDRFYRINEGEEAAVAWDLPSVAWPAASDHSAHQHKSP